MSNGGSAVFRDDIDLGGSINMTGSSKVIKLNSGGYIDFDSTNLQFNTQRNPNTGAFNDTDKSHAHIGLQGPDGGSQIVFGTAAANDTTATTRLTIDKSGDALFAGRVGLNGTTPGDFNADADDLIVGGGAGDTGITIHSGANVGNYGAIYFADGTAGAAAYRGIISYEQNTEKMRFHTNTTEALSLNSDQSATFAGVITAPSYLRLTKAINQATVPDVPDEHVIALYPPTTTNYYGGGISWAEGGNTAASIGVYDAGSGGALGMYLATGNNTTLTPALTITSGQNAYFSANLTVEGSTTTFTPDADSKATIVNAGTDAIAFFAGVGDTLYLGGNNTTGMYLDVSANANFAGHIALASGKYITEIVPSGGGTWFAINHTGNESWTFDAQSGSGSDDYISLGISGGTRAMSWHEDGKIGIGTTTPGAKLSVQNTSTAVTSLLLGNNSGSTGDYQQIVFQYSQTDNSYSSAIRSRVQEGGVHGGNLSFWTHQNATTTLTERMTIDRVGNVGIAVDNPEAKFQVGEIPQSGGSTTTADSLVHFVGTTAPSTVNGFATLKLEYPAGHAPSTAGAQIMFTQGYHSGDTDNTQPVGSLRGWKTGDSNNYGGGLQLLYQPDSATLGLLVGMTLDGSGNATFSGGITANGGITVDGLFIDNNTIAHSGGDITLDAGGDIILDTFGKDILLKTNGSQWGSFNSASNNFNIVSEVSDKDIIFQGNDGGSTVTSLTLDMSLGGKAVFNSGFIDIEGSNGSGVLAIGDPDAANTHGMAMFCPENGGSPGFIFQQQHSGAKAYMETDLWTVRGHNGGYPMIVATQNAGVDLYYDNTKRLETTDSGINIIGTCQPDNLTMLDNEYIRLGNSNDLQIYHDASNSYIKDVGTGNLIITSSQVEINSSDNSENMMTITENGAVSLFHNGTLRLITTSTGVDVTGYYGFSSTGNDYGFYYGVEPGATQGIAIKASDTGGAYFDGLGYFWNSNTGDGAGMFQMQNDGNTYCRYINFFRGSNSNIIGYIGYNATNTATTFSTSSSDERLKKNIVTWDEEVLPKFLSLQPKKFDFKASVGDPGPEKIKGFIAQNEVANFPEVYQLNGLGDDARYGFHPMEMIPYLMKAVKELAEKNQNLEARLAELEK